MKYSYWLILLGLFLTFQIQAQEAPAPIVFIYDASGSMWQKIGDRTKKDIAADVLSEAVGQLPAEQRIGLMAYGHRRKGDCDDVEWLVSYKNDSKETVQTAVQQIESLGKTPLQKSASLAIEQLRKDGRSATIILITDGIESCGGDLCKTISDAKAAGIEFKLHIVGFGLQDADREALKCAAQAGDGRYFDAADAGALSDMLNTATSATVDAPPGNVSVFAVKNGEPVDALVKAFQGNSGDPMEVERTYRDTTLLYLPAGTYRLQVDPLENMDVKSQSLSLTIEEGGSVHRTVSFDVASLEIFVTNNSEGWDALVKLIDPESGKTVATTRTYQRSTKMEVDPGIYDVSINALQIEGADALTTIEGVLIEGGKLERLDYDFKSGTALIGVKTGSELVDATVQIKDVNSGKVVDRGRTYTSESSNPSSYILSPGTYEVTIKTLGKHKGKTETFEMEIVAGEVTRKIIAY